MTVPLLYVVDDDPLIARRLSTELGEETGFEVVAFTASAAAVAAAAERAPDAVIADLGMASPDGLALLAALRQGDPNLAALIMTSAADVDGTARAVAELGPLAHVLKPWQRAELLPKLEAALDRRALLRELEQARAALQQRDQALVASRRQVERTSAKLATTHSELATATERLVEAEQLAAVGRVVGGIAHEITNQLALVGYAEAIKSRVAGDAELSELADAIVAAQTRLATMVDQIRDFAVAADAPRSRPRAEPAALTAIADEALAILRYDRDLRARNLRRSYRAQPLVLLEREPFLQVVINLVTNAAQATAPGDTIEIEIDCDEERGLATLELRDPGQGMPAEVLARLGEPFFSTRGDRGSGLGVGICMRIVEEHGGALVYCSEVGAGTTAHVHLPLLDERAYRGDR